MSTKIEVLKPLVKNSKTKQSDKSEADLNNFQNFKAFLSQQNVEYQKKKPKKVPAKKSLKNEAKQDAKKKKK